MINVRSALLLCVAVPATAQTSDCSSVMRTIWPDRTDQQQSQPLQCALAAWPGGLLAIAVLMDDGDIRAGLLHQGDRQPIARGGIQSLTLAGPWSPILDIKPLPMVAQGAIGVTLTNGHFSTSGSLSSQSLHVFLRRDRMLSPVLAVLLRAGHTREARCRPGQAPPCRQGWTRHWRLIATGPASDSMPPGLTLRDARTGRVISRHRWTGQAYTPSSFARTPPIPPG